MTRYTSPFIIVLVVGMTTLFFAPLLLQAQETRSLRDSVRHASLELISWGQASIHYQSAAKVEVPHLSNSFICLNMQVKGFFQDQSDQDCASSNTLLVTFGLLSAIVGAVGLFTFMPATLKRNSPSKNSDLADQQARRTQWLRDWFTNWGSSRQTNIPSGFMPYDILPPTTPSSSQPTKDLSQSKNNRTQNKTSGLKNRAFPRNEHAIHSKIKQTEVLTLELKVIQGEQVGRRYTFIGGALGLQGIISRGTPKQIVLTDDPKVSMPHAMLDISYRYGQENRIRDLGSKNGTLLNGSRLRAGTWSTLKDGDLLQFGDTKLRYHQAKQELSYECCAHASKVAKPIRLIGTNRWLISRHQIGDFFDLESSDTTISVPHVYIRLYHNGLLEVRDVSSGNGVRLQGRKIKGKESIFNGDRIQLGRQTEIQVVTNISGIPDQINQQWQRVSVIARGGMADVYRVRHIENGQVRALKIPHPTKYRLNNEWGTKYRTLFQRECDLTSQVQHASLARSIESNIIECIGLPYLLLDYVDGPSVQAIIEKTGRLSLANAAEVAIQVARALTYLHARHHHVHCDVKPSNILIDQNGHVYLIDLGVATPIGEKFSHFGVTKYLPKEVLTHSTVSCDTDIYSLGQTLFEMLAARSLSDEYFVHQSPGIKQTAPLDQFTLNRPATLLRRNVSSTQMQKIITKCIHDKRANRYQKIEHLIHDLTPFQHDANLKELVQRTGWKQIASYF